MGVELVNSVNFKIKLNQMHELRKKLVRNKEFNPFSDSYNKDIVIQKLQTYIDINSDKEEDIAMTQTLLTTIPLNDIFKDAFDYLKKNLFKSNLTIEEITQFSISSVNRQYLIIRGQLIQNFTKQKENNYNYIYGQKISSVDSTIGEIDAGMALEGMVDALNLICNYVRYFENKLPQKESNFDEIKSIESIKGLNMASNLFDVLKSTYDQCIWNDGFCEIDFDAKRIDFRVFNQKKLFLKKIGFFRLQKNVSSIYLYMIERIEYDKSFALLIRKHYQKNKNPKRIKFTWVEDGYIKYKLSSGVDKHEFLDELSIDNEFQAYYNFIVETKIPKLDNLNLNDVIKMFSVLQQLIRKVSYNKLEDDSVFRLSDFGKFAYRIKSNEINEYLNQRMTYTLKQVKQFLNLLTCPKNHRINFWSYPLIKIGDDYVFPLLTITSPITTLLADRWLEDGGFNIDERGKLFEKYIIKTLSQILKQKKYFFQIPVQNILTNSKGEKEEIDLIINLKSICLIAEVKCIKYAYEARDEHNAINRLQKGADQIIRKAKFIEENGVEFANEIGDIKGKKIIKVLITNYPIYSGFELNEIPVIDFFMLESYIDSGVISNQKQVVEKGKYKSREIVSETKLYTDEDDFCGNFEDFLYAPPHIYESMKMFKFNVNKITPEFMEWEGYVEAVDSIE